MSSITQAEFNYNVSFGSPNVQQATDIFRAHVVESVLNSFSEHIINLLETVKQMDTALQRRAIKSRGVQGSNDTNLSDSEKINLQVKLDVEAFGTEMRLIQMHPQEFAVYQKLVSEVC